MTTTTPAVTITVTITSAITKRTRPDWRKTCSQRTTRSLQKTARR